MFNFGNKKIDDLTSEVIRLNTVVTIMMKEISLLKQTVNDNSTSPEQNMFSQQENMNNINNASNYKSTTSVPSSKSSLKSYITRSDKTYTNNNDAVIIAASMNDTTPSKCSTYSTTYAATSFPDHSHSSSSHSSSCDSSSCDSGSYD
jgi:hypothetical protein